MIQGVNIFAVLVLNGLVVKAHRIAVLVAFEIAVSCAQDGIAQYIFLHYAALNEGAVAVDTGKQTFFDLQTRLDLASTVFADKPSVLVEPFEGLLVKFARERGAQVILRGLRAVSDFEYEFQLAGMNRSLDKEIETLFLTPADQYAFLSSSLVREVAMLGGDVSGFVHPKVEEALVNRRG